MRPGWVPGRGDLVWISFDPQAGHEQAGRRPAVVLSSAIYNAPAGLALVCPITNQVKGYPYEVAVPSGLPITGVVLSDQVKNLDWRARQARLVGRLPADTVGEILANIESLLSPDERISDPRG